MGNGTTDITVYDALKQKFMVAKDTFGYVLPRMMSPEKFVQITLNSIRANPALMECVPISILGSAMTVAQLGLVTDGVLGEAYLIPYTMSGKKICQVQIGYKGLVKLAYNSGQLSHIYSHLVYEGDHFLAKLGTDKMIEHWTTDESSESEITHAYSVAVYNNKLYDFAILTKKQVDFIRDTLSQYPKLKDWQKKNSPWHESKFYGSMDMKSTCKRVLKTAPISTEAYRAVALDDLGEMGKQDFTAPLIDVPLHSSFDREINEGKELIEKLEKEVHVEEVVGAKKEAEKDLVLNLLEKKESK